MFSNSMFPIVIIHYCSQRGCSHYTVTRTNFERCSEDNSLSDLERQNVAVVKYNVCQTWLVSWNSLLDII